MRFTAYSLWVIILAFALFVGVLVETYNLEKRVYNTNEYVKTLKDKISAKVKNNIYIIAQSNQMRYGIYADSGKGYYVDYIHFVSDTTYVNSKAIKLVEVK